MPIGDLVTVSQNSRSCSTRRSGGLPAMIAELIAPIDMPATQSGWRFGLGQALIDAGLVRPERAAALQQQGDTIERRTFFEPGRFVHGETSERCDAKVRGILAFSTSRRRSRGRCALPAESSRKAQTMRA